MSRQKNCFIMTGFHGVVSQQSVLCRDIVWSRPKGFLLPQSWPGQEFRVATEYLCVTIEFGLGQGSCVATEYFYVRTEYFYVETELARIGRISVTTEDFSFSTKLATKERRPCAHDKP